MQTNLKVRSLIGLWGLALVTLVSSCAQFEGTDPNQDTAKLNSPSFSDPNARFASAPISTGNVAPSVIDGANPGGNRTCDEVATEFETSFTGEGGGERRNWDGTGFTGTAWPEGFEITVTEGKYVQWKYTPPAGFCLKNVAFIVKGGNDANVYYYEADDLGNIVYEDAGLASPINASGGPAGLSNLTICYSIEPCETEVEETCGSNETAWASRGAALDRYNTKGNWATWIAYTQSSITSYRLYAGQFHDIGEVKLEPASGGNVSITITLNENAGTGTSAGGFQATSNNVKIQGYTAAPTGNPAPGQFKTSKGTASGSSYTVIVPYFPFYGIHVDAINIISARK